MSWQAYIDTSLLGSGHIDQAAIYSIAGDSKWASSPKFEPSTAELQTVTSGFQDKSEPKAIQASGFHIGGVKYVTIKADERSIYGMKGKTGVLIVKTVQTMLIAHYPEGVTPTTAATTVENLADYLLKSGY